MKSKRIFLLAVLLAFCGTCATEASAVPMPLTKCQTITTLGSYILTKNITTAGTCFVIQVDNVTIDLDGYTITGNGTGTGIWDGDVARRNITVRNGVITNLEYGINLNNSSRARVERMHVTENTQVGILGGRGAIIKDNIVSDNGSSGISVLEGSLLTGNVANDNGVFGIVASCPKNLIGNMATGNLGLDIIAGEPGPGCTRYNNNPAP